MTWQAVDITTGATALSIWPPVLYYIISIMFGVLLYIGKRFVHRYANFTVFIFYAFFVAFFSGIQLCIFRFGGEFTNTVFGVDLDTLNYDSIFYGSFVFFLSYGIAIPTEFK